MLNAPTPTPCPICSQRRPYRDISYLHSCSHLLILDIQNLCQHTLARSPPASSLLQVIRCTTQSGLLSPPRLTRSSRAILALVLKRLQFNTKSFSLLSLPRDLGL